MRYLYLPPQKKILCKIMWPFCSIIEAESWNIFLKSTVTRQRKLLAILYFTMRTWGHDILYALSSKQAVELLPIEASGHDMLHEEFQFMGKITQGSLGFVVSRSSQPIQVVEIPTFTQADLDRLFTGWDTSSSAIGGWSVASPAHRGDDTQVVFDTWQTTITNTLTVLGQHLLAPIISTLSPAVKRLILLPSAALFLFPLHAASLHGDSDRLCDRYQVSYAPSLEMLANARVKVQTQRPATPSLYAVVNPQQDPTLAFAIAEGTAIAELFAAHFVDKGQSGTKQQVMAEMPGHSYVHFACHGGYHWSDPPTSGLDLSDGRLTLAELQNGSIDLSAVRLVTLSACETGLSDVLQGSTEEYVGLPAGFLLAGVPCVVSSLWQVPDHSTALLMERFYRNHLLRGLNFATALYEAQIWVRELSIADVAQHMEQWYRNAQQRERSELFHLTRYYRYQVKTKPSLHPFEHPYYWAAFTCTGL